MTQHNPSLSRVPGSKSTFQDAPTSSPHPNCGLLLPLSSCAEGANWGSERWADIPTTHSWKLPWSPGVPSSGGEVLTS